MSFNPQRFTYTFPSSQFEQPPPKPQVTWDDVRGLRQILDDMLRLAPLNEAQRAGMSGIRNRLAGLQKDAPPSVCVAVAAWLDAIGAKDVESIVSAGNAAISAANLSGDQAGLAALGRAMGEVTGLMVQSMAQVAPAGAQGGLFDEVGDTSAIDWYEPDNAPFYVLAGQTGTELAAVVDDLRVADRYVKRGARSPNRLLFVGPSGCGKTMAALWIGARLGKPVAVVQLSKLVSSFHGKTARNLDAVFEAVLERDGIACLDELEAIATRRDKDGAGGTEALQQTSTAFNQILDAARFAGLTVIGATNVLPKVDPAVQRRMRKHLHFGPPDEAARRAMLAKWWATAPHDLDAFNLLIARTDGRSGDILERVAEDANRMAARRSLDEVITVDDVQSALRSVPREDDVHQTPRASGDGSRLITLG